MSRGAISSQRVVSVWNKLPEVVVETGTILSFKKHLESYMGKMGIEGMGQMWELGLASWLKIRTAWTSWAEGPVSML